MLSPLRLPFRHPDFVINKLAPSAKHCKRRLPDSITCLNRMRGADQRFGLELVLVNVTQHRLERRRKLNPFQEV
jgi:hypothetical protein